MDQIEKNIETFADRINIFPQDKITFIAILHYSMVHTQITTKSPLFKCEETNVVFLYKATFNGVIINGYLFTHSLGNLQYLGLYLNILIGIEWS